MLYVYTYTLIFLTVFLNLRFYMHNGTPPLTYFTYLTYLGLDHLSLVKINTITLIFLQTDRFIAWLPSSYILFLNHILRYWCT